MLSELFGMSDSMHPHESMHALANSVRKAYNQLRHTTDLLHASTGITAPKRTLLMDLHRYGAQTVPALASARCISRQITQTQVNDLKAEGLVTAKRNPEHKRSVLIDLTTKGRRCVDAMIARENAFMEQLDWLPEADELATCRRVLDRIYAELEAAEGGRTSP